MAGLGGSKTEANLRAAFAAESQSSLRYLYFAQLADVEGQPDAAALLRSLAESETGHAIGQLDFLVDLGDEATGAPLGETQENLQSQIANERSEAEVMYPTFAAEARAEGFTEIADWMDTLARAALGHAERLSAVTERTGSIEQDSR